MAMETPVERWNGSRSAGNPVLLQEVGQCGDAHRQLFDLQHVAATRDRLVGITELLVQRLVRPDMEWKTPTLVFAPRRSPTPR